jgi:uncharacterized protein
MVYDRPEVIGSSRNFKTAQPPVERGLSGFLWGGLAMPAGGPLWSSPGIWHNGHARATTTNLAIEAMPELETSKFQPLPDSIAIALPKAAIAEFCRRWKVREFYLFGSVLRDDFRPSSDVDVMVQALLGAAWGLLELVRMQRDLEAVFGRKVDLLTRKSIEQSENWIRRREILDTARLVCVWPDLRGVA